MEKIDDHSFLLWLPIPGSPKIGEITSSRLEMQTLHSCCRPFAASRGFIDYTVGAQTVSEGGAFAKQFLVCKISETPTPIKSIPDYSEIPRI